MMDVSHCLWWVMLLFNLPVIQTSYVLIRRVQERGRSTRDGLTRARGVEFPEWILLILPRAPLGAAIAK
jgi:hypothetical protein